MRRCFALVSVVSMLAGLLLVLTPGTAAAAARDTDDSCPPGSVPEDGFTDVPDSNTHEPAIDCVVWWELSNGKTPTTYAPADPVSREQMASFIARLLGALGVALPASPPDAFPDDNGSVHEANINALAALGVVEGRNGMYAPSENVSRGQMASFLVRSYELAVGHELPAGEDAFADDNGDTHEANINKSAAAGFTGGRADGTYGAQAPVQRDQMASFLARVVDLGVEDGLATVPDDGEPLPVGDVVLNTVTLCVAHTPLGEFPAVLDWTMVFGLVDQVAEDGGTGTLTVLGMNGDAPVPFAVPAVPGGGVVEVPLEAGTAATGILTIQSLLVDAGGSQFDLTDDLIALVGANPVVTLLDGIIGGTGECPLPDVPLPPLPDPDLPDPDLPDPPIL